MYSRMVVVGVIGYPATNLQPATMAPRATASFPVIMILLTWRLAAIRVRCPVGEVLARVFVAGARCRQVTLHRLVSVPAELLTQDGGQQAEVVVDEANHGPDGDCVGHEAIAALLDGQALDRDVQYVVMIRFRRS